MEITGYAHFNDIAEVNGYYYYSETFFNGLFRVKIGERNAEFLGFFPEEDSKQPDLHRKIVKIGAKLYFIPMVAWGISVYDTETGSFQYIRIQSNTNQIPHYSELIKVNNEFILFPERKHADFLKVDFDDNSLKRCDWLNDVVKKRIMQVANDDYILAPFCAVEHKGMIYCAVKDTNIIMKIDKKKKEYQEIKAPYDVSLKGINIIQDRLVCTLKENALIRYDLRKKIWNIEKFNTPCKNKVYPYLTVASYEEKELVISGREDKLIRPDLDDCEVVLPKELARDAEGTLLFRGFKLQENKIHLFPRGSRGVLTYDFDSKNCDYNEIKYDKECIRIHMKKSDCLLSNGDIMVENDAYKLSDYIDFIKVKKQNNIGVMT